MSVPENNGRSEIMIPQLSSSEACQTLGVQLVPDGNKNDKFNYLLEVANWQIAMSVAKVMHAAAELGLS